MAIHLRVLYGGVFYKNAKNQVLYKKGEVHYYRDIDPDMISRIVIEAMFLEDIGLMEIEEMWYLQHGLSVDKGLKKIENDRAVMEMVNGVAKDNLVHVYVVQRNKNEVSPTDLKNQSPFAESIPVFANPSPSLSSVLTSNTQQQHSIHQPTTTNTPQRQTLKTPQPKTKISDHVILSEGDSEGDSASDSYGRVVGSKSSDSVSEFNYKKSEDEDDDLFEENVDPNVSESKGGFTVDSLNVEGDADVELEDEISVSG